VQLRPAFPDDIERLARLVIGEPTQASTMAGMRLFGLDDIEDAVELNRVMIESTGSWQSTTIADAGGPVGMVQLGEASLALTPEVAQLAFRFYGEHFQQFLAPRVEALQRVQTTYPSGCMRISEIHVDPGRRGKGTGSKLMAHVLGLAEADGIELVGLQTLTSNPARHAFAAWGFEVLETRTDPGFEELTGAPGYHLMVRWVGSG
jgi:ribosomal protein S18 acetylase RimI-like enzyme